MSEPTNTALIQAMYAAFNRGDIQTILANTAPDAEWVNYGPAGAVPYFGDFTGRIADFFKAIGATTNGGNVAVKQYIASGDNVVTQGRYTATVQGSGAKIDSPIAHVFTVRGGKVISWNGYGDTAAVAAAHTGKAVSA
jgi:ketosteroid isomerase-like protein